MNSSEILFYKINNQYQYISIQYNIKVQYITLSYDFIIFDNLVVRYIFHLVIVNLWVLFFVINGHHLLT